MRFLPKFLSALGFWCLGVISFYWTENGFCSNTWLGIFISLTLIIASIAVRDFEEEGK